ncbi:MAG TPA: isoprenylcysteine carboxylmethyltransferase family protein [Candidatus Baltobacteraceae bacterium]|jgi:protein-S-isoprenylcysteine O-methyltransferase Ste14|nr:isoprenylcysteine carboxylmethyltransferase family protein [Candidatus Baltobacteraceae bacterium]
MDDDARTDELQALVFKNRGALLTIPAAILAAFGKPSALSVTVGLPLAIAGELVRCWAVGYSGVTTRGDEVTAPNLITAGPYAHVRNPLYVGNFVTALGFAIAFTGKNSAAQKVGLIGAALGTMAAVYATIIPHEEQFLRSQFGEEFDRYCERVPPLMPQVEPAPEGKGEWDPGVIKDAESRTFATFGAMLAVLALKALKA